MVLFFLKVLILNCKVFWGFLLFERGCVFFGIGWLVVCVDSWGKGVLLIVWWRFYWLGVFEKLVNVEDVSKLFDRYYWVSCRFFGFVVNCGSFLVCF